MANNPHSNGALVVSLATGESGSVAAEARYLPFGETRWESGQPRTDFGFTGQRGEGFGLVDFRARFYSPALMRFVSADSLVPDPGLAADYDRFAYVRSNPLKYVDPSGYKPCFWGDLNPKCDTYSDIDYRLEDRIQKPDKACRSFEECYQAYLTFEALAWQQHYIPSIEQVLYMTAYAEGYSQLSGSNRDAFIEGLARNYYQPYRACERGSPTCTDSKLYKFLSGYQPWWDGSKTYIERSAYLLGNSGANTNLKIDIKGILYLPKDEWTTGKQGDRPWQWHNYWRAPETGEAYGYASVPNRYGDYFWILTANQDEFFKRFIKPVKPH